MTLSITSAGMSALRELENAAMPTGRLSTPEPTIAFTRLTVDEATLLPVDSDSVAAATSGAERLSRAGSCGRSCCCGISASAVERRTSAARTRRIVASSGCRPWPDLMAEGSTWRTHWIPAATVSPCAHCAHRCMRHVTASLFLCLPLRRAGPWQLETGCALQLSPRCGTA